MTWTALSFTSGTLLTASQMNAMQNNFTAVASAESGAPAIAQVNKAWVTFSQSGTIYSSEGVSSVTRSQLGEYTVTWSSPFSSTYAISFGDKTGRASDDPSVRNFRAFTQNSGNVLLTYSAANNSTNAKEDVDGTVSAWQV
jgi:hypothetical protein